METKVPLYWLVILCDTQNTVVIYNSIMLILGHKLCKVWTMNWKYYTHQWERASFIMSDLSIV